MLDNETKEKFIELRATGKSYKNISQDLGVSKPTLIQWSKEFSNEIANMKAIEMDDLQERFYICKKRRIELLGEQVEAIKTELSTRELKSLPTEKLLDLLSKFTSNLRSEEIPLTFVREKNDFAQMDFNINETWAG